MSSVLSDRENSRRGVIVLGSIALIAILATLLLLCRGVGNLTFGILFDDLEGLGVGNPVMLDGMRIGEVVATGLAEDGLTVEITIDSDYAAVITSDCTAMIKNYGGMVNVSGRKILQFYNGISATTPMPNDTVISGMDSWLELKGWQMSKWGREIFQDSGE